MLLNLGGRGQDTAKHLLILRTTPNTKQSPPKMSITPRPRNLIFKYKHVLFTIKFLLSRNSINIS